MMEIEKRIHNGWKEIQEMPKHIQIQLPSLMGMFGKYQYICSSKNGEISLVYIQTYRKEMEWEILCLKGGLFEDVERFPTKKKAMIRIKELL